MADDLSASLTINGVVQLTVYRFECETCRAPIEVHQWPGQAAEIQPHYYCDAPKFSVVHHHPKRLGVVSSADVEAIQNGAGGSDPKKT